MINAMDGLLAAESQDVSRAFLWVIIPIIITVGFASVGFLLRRFITSVDAVAQAQNKTNVLMAETLQRVVHLEDTNQRQHEENIARMARRDGT